MIRIIIQVENLRIKELREDVELKFPKDEREEDR